MDSTFLQGRIDATQLQIIAYEDAALAFAENGGLKTYKLDTGQSIQTVTREDLSALQKTIDGLYNRCTMLEARLNGGTVVNARPAW